MAIAVDVANLGSAGVEGSANTIAFTTGSAVASGARIVLVVSWWDNTTTLSSVAGGGLTWTIHAQGKSPTTSMHVAIVSAPAPSGLASSTTITATMSDANSFIRHIGGGSFTGIDTSTPVDVAGSATETKPTSTSWTTSSESIAAGSLLVGCAYTENTNSTSTPTSPAVEMIDRVITSAPSSLTAAYRIESSAGSYAVAGTWASTGVSASLAVAFKAAAGGGSDATVTAVPTDGTGDVAVPALAAGSTVTSPVLDGTGDIAAPAVSSGSNATVVAVPLDATGDVATPALSAGSTVVSPVLDATGDVATAGMPMSAALDAPTLDATGDVAVPVVSSVGGGGSTVIAVPLDATGDVANPAVLAGAVVVSPTLDATGDVANPTVTGGSPPAGGAGARQLLGVGS
jgi:hypothetical protein